MAIKRFRKVQVPPAAGPLSQVQDNVAEIFNQLLNEPLINHNFLSQVSLAAGTNNVQHGLGRNFRSCLFGLASAAANLTRGTSPDPSKYVTIVASAPTTVDLVVF